MQHPFPYSGAFAAGMYGLFIYIYVYSCHIDIHVYYGNTKKRESINEKNEIKLLYKNNKIIIIILIMITIIILTLTAS
jgi:hypothetical protein